MNAAIANTTPPQNDAWSRYLPMLLALGMVWLCARGMKKSFWTLLGMYWAARWMW